MAPKRYGSDNQYKEKKAETPEEREWMEGRNLDEEKPGEWDADCKKTWIIYLKVCSI